MNEQMEVRTDESRRNSIFFDIHPIPFLHFEWWYRNESGPRDVTDHLLLAHVYGDF